MSSSYRAGDVYVVLPHSFDRAHAPYFLLSQSSSPSDQPPSLDCSSIVEASAPSLLRGGLKDGVDYAVVPADVFDAWAASVSLVIVGAPPPRRSVRLNADSLPFLLINNHHHFSVTVRVAAGTLDTRHAPCSFLSGPDETAATVCDGILALWREKAVLEGADVDAVVPSRSRVRLWLTGGPCFSSGFRKARLFCTPAEVFTLTEVKGNLRACALEIEVRGADGAWPRGCTTYFARAVARAPTSWQLDKDVDPTDIIADIVLAKLDATSSLIEAKITHIKDALDARYVLSIRCLLEISRTKASVMHSFDYTLKRPDGGFPGVVSLHSPASYTDTACFWRGSIRVGDLLYVKMFENSTGYAHNFVITQVADIDHTAYPPQLHMRFYTRPGDTFEISLESRVIMPFGIPTDHVLPSEVGAMLASLEAKGIGQSGSSVPAALCTSAAVNVELPLSSQRLGPRRRRGSVDPSPRVPRQQGVPLTTADYEYFERFISDKVSAYKVSRSFSGYSTSYCAGRNESGAVVGLDNLGNTCFMNSVIQVRRVAHAPRQ
jgi:hypothetical protein